MQITVVYYGRLKEDTGHKREALALDANETRTVGALLELLVARYPGLAAARETVAFTIGSALVNEDAPLHEGDEVGLLPPVSGG
ncbi:MAG: MoaD/ThiS family protein [Anaerolineae bacterium]|nr:MoaD/ThiS family protein [Anaerolineae bacterium]